MHHYINAITNTKGDALIGFYVRCVDATSGVAASLYADAALTPIISVSGVANAAQVDNDGNASFYIGAGSYHIDIYATDSTTFVRRIPNVPMTDGTTAAIGLYIGGAVSTIPAGVDIAVTNGNLSRDVGGALYVRDDTFDLVTYPLAGFTSANGVIMRLSGEQDVNPFMFGAVDGTDPRATGEAVTDCSDALDAMWAFVKYMSHTRGIHMTMDLSGCLGLGISRTWTLDTGIPPNFWLANIFRIRPGRLVAMASIAAMVKLKGAGFECTGQWELYGNTYDNLILGYGYGLTKDGLVCEDTSGSNIGNIMAEGCRRYALRFSALGGTTNIPVTVGTLKAVRCGNWGSTGARKFNGTYASGSWTNNPADSDSTAQVHRLTLTPDPACDMSDLEAGDLVWFNSTQTAVVRTIVSTTSTTITADVYPWLSTEASGTFRAMHGGAVDCKGDNLANLNIGLIEAFVGGTGVRLDCEYAPTIRSLLAESIETAVQIGATELLKSIEGLSIEHYHIENVINSVVDVAASASACSFGVPSNLEGTNRGKFDKCLRLNPSRISAGVWVAPTRVSLRGVSFKVNGGTVDSPRANFIEKNLSGTAAAVIGNSPEYQCGPCFANAFDFYLIAERSQAEQIANRTSKMVEWGPIYGTGTHGAPTGNVVFHIWGSDTLGGSTTIDGGATTTLTSSDGALQGVAVYEPPATGDNGNWKIFSWKATGA